MELRPFHTDLRLRLIFGESFSPEDKRVRLFVWCFNSMNKGEIYRKSLDLTKISKNIYEATFLGKKQRFPGEYSLTVVLNPLEAGMAEKTVFRVFKLVFDYQGSYNPEDLLITVDLMSEGELGLVHFLDLDNGERGLVRFLDLDTGEEGEVFVMK